MTANPRHAAAIRQGGMLWRSFSNSPDLERKAASIEKRMKKV